MMAAGGYRPTQRCCCVRSPARARRPLLVSSKGVGRVLNGLLGGQGRMQVGNGEIVEFSVAPGTGASALRVSRPAQA